MTFRVDSWLLGIYRTCCKGVCVFSRITCVITFGIWRMCRFSKWAKLRPTIFFVVVGCSFSWNLVAVLNMKTGGKHAYWVNFYNNTRASTAPELLCCCFASNSLEPFPWVSQTTLNKTLGRITFSHYYASQEWKNF